MKTKLKTTLLLFMLLGFDTLQAQTFQWANTCGGTSDDEGCFIAKDGSGNILSTGVFNGVADFDPGPGVSNLTSAGGMDMFVQKMDANGNFLWAKSCGGAANDGARSVSVDASGNVYIGGFIFGPGDYDPGPGVAYLTSAGMNDVFILKLDPNGNFLWAKAFGGVFTDHFLNLVNDASGNVYACGYFSLTVDFDPGPGGYSLTSAGGTDVFVEKLDANGNFLWAKTFGGTSDDQAFSIALDASGNVYSTGDFAGPVDFDPGPGTNILTSAGLGDVFIQKMDANGDFLWAASFGGILEDDAYYCTTDAGGNVYTTGFFKNTVDFDPGPGTNNLTSVGGKDIFIQKMDANGNFVWAKAFGGSLDDWGFSIDIDVFGNVYSCGSFAGLTDFDPGNGIYNLTPAGGIDPFIHKMDANGNFLWATSFGGPLDDIGASIIVENSGNLYIGGHFEGTADFDPGPAISNQTAVGGLDVFVLKLGQAPVSADDIEDDLVILAYPNPSEGTVHIKFPVAADKVELILSDILGKIISTQTYQTLSDISLQLPDANGIYFLTICTSAGRQTLRLTKQ